MQSGTRLCYHVHTFYMVNLYFSQWLHVPTLQFVCWCQPGGQYLIDELHDDIMSSMT
jgi:hypothetical protein